ncbi:hypothetical protein BJV78DRAFT_1276405 [Lactifluus subvellereus]|nr:hypothetical protein BJV78DRAFT_1276405 [Lactifluus subvellereus]
MLAVASSTLPWNWSSIYEHGIVWSKSPKKHPIRTRAQQLAAKTNDGRTEVEKETVFYPGLVNISGTYCFMNSTMQALASLSYLQPHIDAIHAKAEAVDIPTPVVDALRDLLQGLNTPTSHYRSIRPVDMIGALSQPEPGKRIPLFSSREHQDAQELFQLVSEYIKKEATAVSREGTRDLGFSGLSSLSSSSTAAASADVSKGVFDGLTANRRSCCECGYTEAVMHFPFDNWQLTVPRVAGCRLEDCLIDYTRLEILSDCICRKCSMRATLRRLEQDAERLTTAQAGKSSVSQSKKKRVREVKRLALRLKTALEEGRIEEDIKGVKIEKVFSRASTKQAMIARPPPALVLHLSRSVHFGTYASKNTARVQFSEVLDLTQFTTSGMLSTSPSIPISSPMHIPSPAAAAPASSLAALLNKTHAPTSSAPRVLYRLAAVVCHYGQHSFGHYVCFRRKPHGQGRVVPPRLDEPAAAPGKGWLRASDESVREVGIEAVLHEGAGVFMLYYERVKGEDTPAADDVEEVVAEKEKGPVFCLQDAVKCESVEETEEGVPVVRARVVRSVSLGRDEEVGGTSVLKQEAATADSETLPQPSSLSLEPAKPDSEVTPAVESPTTLAEPGEGFIPDAPTLDEPQISLPRTMDLRA